MDLLNFAHENSLEAALNSIEKFISEEGDSLRY